MKRITITTGILRGVTINVDHEDEATITGNLDNGARITLPKDSHTGIRYYTEEVEHAESQ